MRTALVPVVFLMFLSGIVVWRVWWWQGEELGLRRGEELWLELRLTRPIEVDEYGCMIEWRGWYIDISQTTCDIGRLNALSAGDVVSLKVNDNSRPDSGQRLRVKTPRVISRVNPSITSIFWWQRMVWKWREQVVRVIKLTLPGREAGLVAGILLGVKSELADNFREALIRTGTMHVVAASGYNIAVVMSTVSQLLVRLVSRRKAALISLLLIWAYVFMAGSDPPIVRAGLMGSLTLFSWIFGREVWVLFGYLICGLGLAAVEPWLINSVSFQLSMAATAGVIWETRWLNLVLCRIRNWIQRSAVMELWWDNFITSLAATGAVFPLLLVHFGEVSLLGLVVNPFVLWLVPMIMYLGAAIAISGFIWFPLAQAIGWLMLPIARGWVFGVMAAAQLPGGMIAYSGNWLWTWGWWVAWGGVMLLSWKRRARL